MKTKISLSIVLMTSFALISVAAEKKSYKKSHYGMAGCGITTMFIKDNTMLAQLGAAVVRDWFLSGTSGQTSSVSSGTSNCTEVPDHAASRIEQEVFVRANMAALSKESAQGTGEHLEAFAEVLGCNGGELSRLSQEQYSNLYNTNDSVMLLDNYKREIQASPRLANSCQRVI